MTVLLTVRGTPSPKNLDATRVLHNETAGSQPGIAAARALGDLSHNVYVKNNELLFLDRWVDPQGIFQFFGNTHVQEQAAKLFANKDATVWMPAQGSFSYALPGPKGRNERHVGVIRGPIADPHKAIAVFAKVDEAAQRIARQRGLLSHEIFIKVGQPGEPLELLGLDVWHCPKGMQEHYNDSQHMTPLAAAFSGRPDPTVWLEAPGEWSEW